MEKLKNYLTKRNIVIVGGAISIVTTIVLLLQSNPSSVEVSSEGWKLKTAQKENKSEQLDKKTNTNESNVQLMVDVKGEVQKPGVYVFQEGDRIADIVEKAGGFTSNADSNYINLAAIVEDSMIVYIPKIGELDGANPYMSGSPNINSLDKTSQSKEDVKVNINTATVSELETLTGVGPSRAEAIIEKRKEIGKFQSIEDLMQVTGIGEKSFEKIKDFITVN